MRVDGRAWHIAQRVSIRREVFSGDEDRVTYLQLVRENLAAASVCVLVEKRGQPDHVYLGALPDFSLAYYHTDHLGSSRLLSSTNGYPVWQGNFAAFGQEISPQSTVNHFKFTDLEHDSESNLEHTWFRQLSSTQGRWLTPDPYMGSMDLTNPQSLNRYAYVMNNPMDLTDPLGLDPPNCGNDSKCWNDWAKATYGGMYGGAQPFPPSPNWNDPFFFASSNGYYAPTGNWIPINTPAGPSEIPEMSWIFPGGIIAPLFPFDITISSPTTIGGGEGIKRNGPPTNGTRQQQPKEDICQAESDNEEDEGAQAMQSAMIAKQGLPSADWAGTFAVGQVLKLALSGGSLASVGQAAAMGSLAKGSWYFGKAAALNTYHAAAANFHLLNQIVAGCPGVQALDLFGSPE
ncbi:MAG TPA: RHS repeat-associated core domain-containing protein [Terriglobales bacterium]